MLTYFIFIFILYFSFEYVGKYDKHEIIYFNEYDITKNSNENKVNGGTYLLFIMKIEKNYDLNQLTVRFKIKGLIKGRLYMYLYSIKPENFIEYKGNYVWCEQFDRLYLEDDEYNIFQYYFKDISYENVNYVAFYTSTAEVISFWTIFVFPLKIFNLTDSTELNINSYYQNSIIPKNACFYIRFIQDLLEANILIKVPHNSEANFNLKVKGTYYILSDEDIKQSYNYYIKPNLLKKDNNEKYDNYIYNIKASSFNFC